MALGLWPADVLKPPWGGAGQVPRGFFPVQEQNSVCAVIVSKYIFLQTGARRDLEQAKDKWS